VVDNRGSVVKSDFYTKPKKLDIKEGKRDKLRRSCDTGMRSAQSGDCVLPSAGARRYKANSRGTEHRKNPSQSICCTRLPLIACEALDNVSQHRIPTCVLIRCTNVLYVVEELHNI